MSSSPDFKGWVAHDPSAADGNMQWGDYTPKNFESTDIEMEISHCGVCGSDIHTLRSGWGPSDYPLVVGHEIIGKITRVGDDVKDLKVGDRVGVGAQSDCCESCRPCKTKQESNCNNFVMTYNAKYKSGDKAMGGYAKNWRGPASFAIPIPEGLPSEFAAPLMCGGVTVYNPLVSYGAGPGKRVGVVGIGGLGHFALLFAKALGCDEVVAISRSSSKKADAMELGADKFIATGEDPEWMNKNAAGLDIIISTISGGFPLDQYLNLLDVNGTFVQLGAPDDPLPSFSPMGLIFKNLKIAGSLIGTRQHIRDMLELAKKTNLKAWVQVRPMSEANDVIVDFEKGLPRYPPHNAYEPTTSASLQSQPTAILQEHRPDHTCQICAQSFQQPSRLKLHLRKHETYKCEPCDTYFQDSKDARKDLERHKNTKAHRRNLGLEVNTSQFVCPVEWCAKSMPRKDNLNRHIKSQHPDHTQLK
ncbi:uncharacterized protein ALTATR162_LOCUS7044 [Alternaria atra]|uniref:alcohol dehydrogenase (NADP(+)) n=1 Tax=Alternaria atra TaxID=119953 RepID=A0A8J2N161_9PLEO|nr:uncharacterized protein ALTATR162_LOCUS7044 [Alternaria atra]CAG5169527.1 unnamed protein product [Alternaria atra]